MKGERPFSPIFLPRMTRINTNGFPFVNFSHSLLSFLPRMARIFAEWTFTASSCACTGAFNGVLGGGVMAVSTIKRIRPFPFNNSAQFIPYSNSLEICCGLHNFRLNFRRGIISLLNFTFLCLSNRYNV